ncbi:MAG: ABC transporter substrate-binding protein [Treponema sp. CETP13]|nr:MAG: ABC transporter substrate-binding protein [Treponema sp. CETP13]
MLFILSISIWAGGQKDTSNTISFAGSGGYPPFNYMTAEGTIVGFDVDVANEIATRLDKTLDYKTTAWDGIIEGLRAGRYDGILGSMGITEERQKIVNFSTPYYYSGPQLIVQKGSKINSFEDLTSESKVGVATGTTFEKDAKAWGVTVKLYEDDNQTLMELLNGRLDAVLTDRIVGLNAISKISGGNNLLLVGSVIRTEKMGIAFNKKDSDLCARVNSILEDMRKDGTLQNISEKWFPGSDITVK